MAILMMDGFDYYNTAGLTGFLGAGWDAGSTTPFSGGVYGYGGQIRVNNSFLYKTLSGNVTTFIYGGHYTPETMPTASMYSLYDGATAQCSFRTTAMGAIEFYRGTTTLLGTSTAVLKIGQPVWVSFKIVFSGTVGTCTVTVNGVTVLTLTGLNNISTANAYCNQFRFTNVSGATSGFHDNVFLCDSTGSAPYNDILDERRIYFLLPTGAGTASQFTANGAATFWQATDENPSDGDTTYGSSTVPTNRSDTTRAALTGPTLIDAVKYNLTMRKDDAGVRTLSPTVRQGGVYYDATAISLGSAFQLYPTYYFTEPDASGDWTLAHLNAAEFGVLDVA